MDRRLIASLACVSIVVLAACAGETGDETEMEGDTAADMTQTTPAVGTMGAQFQMTAKNESGISGNVRLSGQGDSLRVRVQLQGVEAGTQYASHIHGGTCAQPGGVIVPLESVPGAEGMVETSVAMSQLSGEDALLVQSHGSGGAPIACGAFPDGWRDQLGGGTGM